MISHVVPADRHIRDDVLCFENQWKEAEKRYDSKIVQLQRLNPASGDIAMIRVTVIPYGAVPSTAPKPKPFIYRADGSEDQTEQISFTVFIHQGYPTTRPDVYFDENARLKHMNAFKSRKMCIGTAAQTNLSVLLDHVIGACIYNMDPAVSNPISPANSDVIQWQMDMAKAGRFPLIPPEAIFRRRTILPPINSGAFAGRAHRQASQSLPGIQRAAASQGRLLAPTSRDR